MPFSKLLESCRSLRKMIEDTIFDVYQFHSELNFGAFYRLFDMISSADDRVGNQIFTTNYDRIIEELCQRQLETPFQVGNDEAGYDGYDLVDGFVHDPIRMRYLWNPNISFNAKVTPGRVPIKLHKLHGSLDWKSGEYGIERVSMETKLSQPTTLHKKDLLIYPGSKEAPEEEPFRSLYERFESMMKNTRRCFVIGYRFNDPYLNRIFRDFVNSPYGQLLVMSKTCKETVAKNLLQLKDLNSLIDYVQTEHLIPIPCHFGDENWINMTTFALRKPMATEPITKQ